VACIHTRDFAGLMKAKLSECLERNIFDQLLADLHYGLCLTGSQFLFSSEGFFGSEATHECVEDLFLAGVIHRENRQLNWKLGAVTVHGGDVYVPFEHRTLAGAIVVLEPASMAFLMLLCELCGNLGDGVI
jgi:hypothetical protein